MKNKSLLLMTTSLVILALALALPAGAAAQDGPQEGNNGLWAINIYRTQAAVPPVVADPLLNSRCMLHAAYMAENQVASLSEDPLKTMYSSEGNACAGNALIYLLPTNPLSKAANVTVDAWMSDPTTRMWLLYPTMAAVGYGYKTNKVADGWVTSAALDVLSGIDFSADQVFPNWPARFPSGNQTGVPASIIPITVWWPYAGPAPAVSLGATRLTTQDGTGVAITVDNDPDTYGGHKHITLIPKNFLEFNTIYVVHIEGSYAEQPFTLEWKFSTGSTPIPE